MSPAARDLLRGVIEPLCDEAGIDLEDLEVTTAGRRRRVRLLVDRDGGVGLDECAELSRAVSRALDVADALGPAPYTLEVSSPGVTRPLTLPRHWRRSTGRVVRAVLAGGDEVTGRVTAADGEAATLAVDGAAEPRRVPYAQVGLARVQVEFRDADPAVTVAADDGEG